MAVKVIQCGEYANTSERTAIERLRGYLTGSQGEAQWYLFTNVEFFTSNERLPDEVDLIVVGPSGVQVIEIKHWDTTYIQKKENQDVIEHEAKKLNQKVRRVKGYLERQMNYQGFIEPRMLMTRVETERFKSQQGSRKVICGVAFYGLREWKELLGADMVPIFTSTQIETAVHLFSPMSAMPSRSSLRQFNGYFDMVPIGPQEDTRRVFRAYKQIGGDRVGVILHLYDLTAIDAKHPKYC